MALVRVSFVTVGMTAVPSPVWMGVDDSRDSSQLGAGACD